MKDYELIEKLEKQLFAAREDLNFASATIKALDEDVEEKKTTFEKLREDYDNKVKRLEGNCLTIKEQIKSLEKKLGMAGNIQTENARKKAALHKLKKKVEQAKKKEPVPVMVIPEPEEKPEDTIEELLEQLPKPEPKENGKVSCPLCSKEYSKQGFPAHFKACSSKFIEEGE